ncbi:HDOD domain-containing protein [Massilia sp. TWP1-3-3]|uniref:HDOD domain-containing protein n=1 Tax=Massilia sp. TWP1-3-3 TaxID=2804573 RepID=UPI003CF8E53A
MFQWLQKIFSSPVPEAPPTAPGTPAARPAPPPAARAMAAVAGTGTGDSGSIGGLSFDQRDTVNTTYYNWLFGSKGASELETTEPENQVLGALATILKSQQSGAALVRRLPGLIPQLLQSLRSDTFSGAHLSRTISSDVVLVAAVIRAANNSFIGYGTTITSVEHAIMLIGTEGLRHLITSVAFRPIIDMNSGHYTRALAPRIWDQSERAALANRMLAEEMGVDPFEAFLAGLVQYVGLIVTLRIMDQCDKDGKQLGSDMFCASLLRDARALSCSIGREWDFPASVVTAIGEQAGARKGVQVSPMGRLLSQSDYLSKVRILAESALADSADAALFKGLTPAAMACYHRLDAIADEAPAAIAVPAAAL